MGRPRRYGDRVSTAVRFDPALHAALAAAADDREVSVNWIVNRACEEWLARRARPLPPPGTPQGDAP